MSHKCHKTKRRQPAPKKKKKRGNYDKITSNSMLKKFKNYGKELVKVLENKDALNEIISDEISKIEGYFRYYDSIQLLGGIGLYLIDNLSTLEKTFYAQMSGSHLALDEDAEVIAEYALNFGLSMPNEGLKTPTPEIINDLRESLRKLSKTYSLLDMPLENNAIQFIDWIIHSETIAVRGDGYSEHLHEVFKELFSPHSEFYKRKFGFSPEDLLIFLNDIENRIICKLGSQNMVYGPLKLYDRWLKWEETTYGPLDELGDLTKKDYSKGIMGEFLKANPDVRSTDDGMHPLLFQPDDYSNSDMIFWVYPQNDVEKSILTALSVEFGDNSSFIAEGNYKGNIMNGHSIYEKPFVKVEDRFYCFTPLLPYRNMFLIAEKLMKWDKAYYEANFQNNTNPIARDNYIERKVCSLFESLLPNVNFYSSVTYNMVENGIEKKPELDILGVSDKAIYIIEVKGHELTHKDRVGLKGAKDKFKDSVTEACGQSNRALRYIEEADSPVFNTSGESIYIDKTKPIYKIAVTFQHYSTMIGYIDKLIEAGLLKDEHRDTWIVSLFDFMVFSDFIQSEDQFVAYLNMHKIIYNNHSTYNDELDLLGQFLNNGLADKVQANKPMLIIDGHQYIDEEYSSDFKIPV